MYRVALNVAISGHRQRRREKQNRLPWDSIQEPAMPHADAEMTRRSEELRGTIESLPDLDRALLLLYLEGLSHQQMGEVMGMTEANVGVRLSRLRQRIKDRVTQNSKGDLT
jgi:RNA polymerase sigma-70 factor, ECF subfamily